MATLRRTTSVLEMGNVSQVDLDRISQALVTKEGLLASVFAILRGVPRRVIMILKLNDLTRSVTLD